MKKIDVTALGEILIDFTYAGISDNGARLFQQNPGGAPANVLAAVQKLGGETAFIGKVGNDMHGTFLKETLEGIHISTKGLVLDDHCFTTLAFVNLSPSGERSFSFARKPGADTRLDKSEVDFELIKNSKVLHVGSLSLTDEPARSATIAALEFAKENGITISYDPNYRAMLWKDKEAAIKGMKSILNFVDIIKISDEEIELLTDATTPQGAVEELLNQGISCVIVTLGSEGAYIATKSDAITIPSVSTSVVDTTGAGDSFMGGFLFKMTRDNKTARELCAKELKEYGEFATRVASKCISKKGAINAMPTLEELI